MNKSSLSKTKQYFERSAELFDSIYTHRKSVLGRFLDRLLRPDIERRFILTMDEIEKTQPKSLLDVGVGPGQYLQVYAKLKVPDIVGLDFSAPMIELAKKRVGIPPAGVRLTFVVDDFMAHEFEQNYDIIVAMGVLDYVAEPVEFLAKMKTLAIKKALVSFPSYSIWRTPIRKIRYRIKRCPVYFFNRRKIEALRKECGFKSCQIIKIKGSGMDYWVKLEC